jgi:hypothetical protein
MSIDETKTLMGHGANLFSIEIDGVPYEIDDAIVTDIKGNRVFLQSNDYGENDDIAGIAQGSQITVAGNLLHVLDFEALADLFDWDWDDGEEELSPRNPTNGVPKEFTLKVKGPINPKQETDVASEALTFDPVPNGTYLSFTGTIAKTPIKPGSVTITVGAVSITDDGMNVLAGTNVIGTIEYLTGDFTLVFSAGSAPAGVDARTADYTYLTSKQWQWLISRAMLDSPAPSGALNFKRGEKTTIPVQFRVLRDLNSTTSPFGVQKMVDV